MTGDEVQVQDRCHVAFIISSDYKEKGWRDVVPMDVGDALLRRTWTYDKNGIRQERQYTY